MYLPIETECCFVGYWINYQQSGNFSNYFRDNGVARAGSRGWSTHPVTGKAMTAHIACAAHVILLSFCW